MAERTVDQAPAGVPELDEILEAVLLQALDEAKEKLAAGDDVVPFTALAVGDSLFIETHPAEDTEDCFKLARHTVQNARGARAYAFCYDGYVDTDDGAKDALIAEGGVPGDVTGHAVGCFYTMQESSGDEESDVPAKAAIDDEAVYIGQAPNFMEFAISFDDEDADAEAEADVDEAPAATDNPEVVATDAADAGADGEREAPVEDAPEA